MIIQTPLPICAEYSLPIRKKNSSYPKKFNWQKFNHIRVSIELKLLLINIMVLKKSNN
ncbi:hypothetical protein NIES19_22090 [Anabaena cylindrica PCC 7122]|nr:hypothetical protein NIES19_22090 [Anabaena cylindrica PCC 7122]